MGTIKDYSVERFDESSFEKLRNAIGEEDLYEFEDIIPTTWNHLKKEYVAIILGVTDKYDGLDRNFISSRYDYTSSKANAKLEAPEPRKIGTLIEVKEGSYKNMYKRVFRKEEDGWRLIAEREGQSSYFGGIAILVIMAFQMLQ